MAYYVPMSTDEGFEVHGGDSVYIGRNVQISLDGKDQVGLGVTNAGNSVYCDGTIASYIGVFLDSFSDMHISESGKVFGFEMGVYGLETGVVLSNDGEIYGGSIGINMQNGFASFTNTGTVEAGTKTEPLLQLNAAIAIHGSDPSSIVNSGTIKTDRYGGYAIDSTDNSADTVINSGSIIGNVALGGGEDVFNTSAGKVTGVIDAGAGNDKVVGSARADQIIGGEGRDVLYGKGGADSFAFQTLADSTMASAGRDIIQDFSVAQNDRLDLHLIDADTITAGDQAFAFIGNTSFSHHAGELQVKMVGGNTLVSGDVDGNGKADFAEMLHGKVMLTASSFVL